MLVGCRVGCWVGWCVFRLYLLSFLSLPPQVTTGACPKCQQPLKAGARFCGNCGATATSATTTSPRMTSPHVTGPSNSNTTATGATSSPSAFGRPTQSAAAPPVPAKTNSNSNLNSNSNHQPGGSNPACATCGQVRIMKTSEPNKPPEFNQLVNHDQSNQLANHDQFNQLVNHHQPSRILTPALTSNQPNPPSPSPSPPNVKACSGDTVEVLGRSFHPRCFTCRGCSKVLRAEFLIVRG